MTDRRSMEAEDWRRYVGDAADVPDDLVRLDRLDDFELAEGEPDPRGWELRGPRGEAIGQILSLLVSPSARKAYFATVAAGREVQGGFYVVPLADVRFDEDERAAYVPYGVERLRNAPAS